MAACAAVHEKFPNLYIIGNAECFPKALNSVYAPDAVLKLGGSAVPVALDQAKPDSDEVISFFGSQYFLNLVEIYQEWHDLGYIKQEHITHSPVDPAMGFNNGNYLMSYGGTGRIYGDVDNNMGEQADIQYLVIGDTPSVITNNYDWGRAVSAADQANVEHYLRLINWVYENEENYIKDKDYTILEDGTIE